LRSVHCNVLFGGVLLAAFLRFGPIWREAADAESVWQWREPYGYYRYGELLKTDIRVRNMQKIVLLSIILLTSFGLFSQCIANLKAKRAEFLSFPMGVFLITQYPFWATLGALRHDWTLLGIMIVMGLPSFWLSTQYFRYEWPRRSGPLALEEKFSIMLLALGFVVLGVFWFRSGAAFAIALTGAYFTSCLMIYSYLVKLWKVGRGEQTLDGLRLVALVILALCYGAMIFYGSNNSIPLMRIAYVFAEICVLLAIAYKLFAPAKSMPRVA